MGLALQEVDAVVDEARRRSPMLTLSLVTRPRASTLCALSPRRSRLGALLNFTLALCALALLSAAPAVAQEALDEPELELEESPPPSKAPTAGSAAAKSAQEPSAQVKVEKVPQQARAQAKRGEELYKQQIAQIEAQVNELKEEVFRSRTRIDILKETVLAIGIAGAQLQLVHRNEMGANFKLERALYIIDGTPYSYDEKTYPGLDGREELQIVEGPLSQENHTIQVELVFRGNGYGVFSYLKEYRITVDGVYSFRPEEGKKTIIKAIAYERGGIKLELLERPAIRFDISEIDLAQDRPQAK